MLTDVTRTIVFPSNPEKKEYATAEKVFNRVAGMIQPTVQAEYRETAAHSNNLYRFLPITQQQVADGRWTIEF